MTAAVQSARFGPIAAEALEEERVAFIRRTYAHLGLAVLAFVAIEAALIQSPLATTLIPLMLGSNVGWLITLGLFMGVGFLADRLARSEASPGIQYLGLALYTVAEAIIFLPLIYMAVYYSSPSVLPNAATLTLVVFGGLTAMVFITKKDFSFLRGALTVVGLLALGLIVVSLLFGFSLGMWFSVAMVGLAAGYIVYYTSNILHHYRTDQHVAASLALFSALALMFWYILRLFMGSRR